MHVLVFKDNPIFLYSTQIVKSFCEGGGVVLNRQWKKISFNILDIQIVYSTYWYGFNFWI